jgi:LemA protein
MLWIVLIAVGALVPGLLSTYRSIIHMKERIDTTWENINLHFKKRSVVISEILEILRYFVYSERETLRDIGLLNNASITSKTPDEKVKAEKELEEKFGALLMVVKNNPEIKINRTFYEKHKQLNEVEEKLSMHRQNFNSMIKIFNEKIGGFPGNLMALALRLKKFTSV